MLEEPRVSYQVEEEVWPLGGQSCPGKWVSWRGVYGGLGEARAAAAWAGDRGHRVRVVKVTREEVVS